MNKTRAALGVLCTALLATAAAPAAALADDPIPPPDVRKVFFSHTEDGSPREWKLDATVRFARTVRFRTRFDGRRAVAPGRQTEGGGRNQWIARGGQNVIPLIRDSLDARGFAKVAIAARGPGGRDRARVRIVLSDCHMDPPFYPLSCSEKP